MNKTFHSVWNASKQAYVAAAETVSAKGKPSSGVKLAAALTGLMGGLLANGAYAQTAPPPTALPTGGQVSAGQARIGQSGANLVINQSSDRAAINWQTFNVGKDAHVQFNQPSAASVTLNRVLSNDPSQIFGQISANGQVILTNPSGVFFGKNARVDVGGLIATTHGMSDADFMAGKNRFDRNGSTASVVNEGEIKAALGGYIALLAPEVRNQGAVIAQMGTVAMAAGEAFDLKFDSNNRLTSLRVTPSQIQALVDNRLAVQAPGGLVIISAQSMDRLVGGVVKNSGTVEATGLQQQGGRIVLSGSTRVQNAGTLDASSAEAAGKGGSISLQGDSIELQSSSRISATGPAGGGTVLVGGNWQGSADPLLQATAQPTAAATTVSMASGASIDASATHNGDGGMVVLWSDVKAEGSETDFAGQIRAQGGANSGQGGRVETSGYTLRVAETAGVNTLAPKGNAGQWLLDPIDFTISAGTGGQTTSGIGATTLADNLLTTNVAIATDASTAGNGDILVAADVTQAAANSLTLTAHRDITISGALSIGGGITLNAGRSIVVGRNLSSTATNSTGISLSGTRITQNAYSVTTQGSPITYSVTNSPQTTSVDNALWLAGTSSASRAIINANGGNVSLSSAFGASGVAGNNDAAITLQYANILTSGAGTITLNGDASNVLTGTGAARGVMFSNEARITSGAGAITIAGKSNTSSSFSQGLVLYYGQVLSNSGPILLKDETSSVRTAGTGTPITLWIPIGADGTNVVTSSSDITLQAASFTFDTGNSLNTSGAVVIEPAPLATSFGTTQTLTNLRITGNPSSVRIGSTSNTADINMLGGSTSITAAGPISFYGGAMDLRSPAITATNSTITLQGSSITVHSTVTAANLVLSGGSASLATASNNVGTLAATGMTSLSYVDSNALTIGTVGATSGIEATGNVSVSTPTGALTLAGNITTTTGGVTFNAATVTGSGNIALATSQALSVTQSGNSTYSGNVSGTSSTLTKLGAGTLTLTGANSYTGATTITAGTLQVGSGSTTGTLGSGAVTNNAALSFNRSDDLTVGGDISGTGTLTKLGAGTLTLTGANSYTGATTISAGTLQVGSGSTTGTLGSGAVTNNAALSFNRSDNLTAANAISGSGTLTQLGAGTLTLTGANSYTGATTITAGTLQVGSGSTTGSLGSGAVTNNSALTFNRSNNLVVANVISGSGSLTKLGAGTLSLSGANSYAGTTTISAGVLRLGAAGDGTNSPLGTIAAGTVVANGATLDLNGYSLSTAEPLSISGSGAVGEGGALVNSSFTTSVTYSGLLSLGGNASIYDRGGSIDLSNTGTVTGLGSTLTLSGQATDNRLAGILNLGSGGLISASGGYSQVWTLSGANTYTGPTAIDGGTLKTNHNSALGIGSAVTFLSNGNGVLDISGGDLTIGSLATTGSGNISLGSNTLTIGTNNTSTTFAGVISGAGGVTKVGTGTLTLSGTNTFTGSTTVSAGTLQVGDGGTTGTLGSGAVSNNSALTFNRSNGVSVANVISGSGSLTKLGSGTLILWGANSYTGATTISAGNLWVGFSGSTTGTLGSGAVTNNAALSFNRTNDLTVANAISGTGTLTQLGAGTLTLTGANSYTGATTITAGTLQVGSGSTTGTLGSGAVTNNAALSFNRSDNLTAANAISGSGTLTQLGAGTLTLTATNSYAGATTISAGTLQVGSGSTTGTLGSGAVTNNAALRFNRSDNLTAANAISGTGTLTKLGAGTLTLTGTNNYSGTTTITAGTLQVGDGGTTGALGSGAVTNNAALRFNRSNNLTAANAISGTGTLTKLGAGTLTLSGVSSYTGATTITSGGLVFSNNTRPSTTGFSGAGQLTIEPSTSFSAAFNSGSYTYATTLTGLTLGKSGNTSDIDVSTAISVAGPVTVASAGLITLSAGITSAATSGTGISLTGQKINQNGNGVVVQTAGANISYTATNVAQTSSGDTGIRVVGTDQNSTPASINAGGGNISLNASFASTGVGGGADYAIRLSTADLVTSGSGSITLTGNASNVLTSSTPYGIDLGNSRLIAGSGGLSVNYSGNLTSTTSYGIFITAGNRASQLLAPSGDISLIDQTSSGRTTGFHYSVYFAPTSLRPNIGAAAGSAVTTSSANLTIQGDRLAVLDAPIVNTTGAIVVEPVQSSFAGVMYTSSVSSTSTPSSVRWGKAGNTSNIIVNTALNAGGPISLYGGDLTLQAGVSTPSGTLTLQATNSITHTASGFVSANSLLLGGGNVTLTHTSNNITTLAGTGVGNLTFFNSGGMTIGTVGATSGITAPGTGTISVATNAGNLTLASNLSTNNATSNAILINAGRVTAAGTSTGGDLIVSGSPVLTVGSGGTIRLMTGSVSGSTGLESLVGSGSGRFRYNSDENSTGYTTALSTNVVNAIYRERPAVTVAGTSNVTITYGDSLTLSGTATGTVNGDTLTMTVANPQLSTAGLLRYSNDPYSASSNLGALGYNVSGLSSTVTVNRKALTVSGLSSANKTYNGLTTATVSGTAALQSSIAAASGVSSDGRRITGDTVSLSGTATGTFNSKDVATATTVTFTGLSLSGADSANYTLTPASASYSITHKALSITTPSIASKVYDGSTAAGTVTVGTLSGLVTGETVTATGSATALSSANAASYTTTVSYTLANGTGLASNYSLANSTNVAATIGRATLTVRANDDAKFLTQADTANFAGVSYTGFVNGETASVLSGTPTVTRSNASNSAAGTYTSVLQPGGLTLGNYQYNYVNGDFTVVGSNQMLVRVNNASTTYGTAAAYSITSAAYYNGTNVVTLGSGVGSIVDLGNNRFTVNDGASGSATFTVVPSGSQITSTAGQLKVGSYQLQGTSVTTVNAANFSNNLVMVGSHAVATKAVTASIAAAPSAKVYDGNTSMASLVPLSLTGLVASDVVTANGVGTYASRNAGTSLAYTVENLALAGADAANYRLAAGATVNGTNGAITAKAITLNPQSTSRTYDGASTYTASAADLAAMSALLGVNGDTVSAATLAFADKNVGSNKTLTATAATIADGNGGNNYTVTLGSNSTSAITRLNSVTWQGGTSGNWFNPANWVGGAVPDLSNVANVVIPSGVTVSFGSTVVAPAQSGVVSIDGLTGAGGNLSQTAGTLNVGAGGITLGNLTQSAGTMVNTGSTTLDAFTQSGGSFTGTGNMTAASFAQTGGSTSLLANLSVSQGFDQGSLGNVSVGGNATITDTAGGLQLGNLTSTGSLSVSSTDGAITQTSGTALSAQSTSSFTATQGGQPAAIDLSNAGNDFGGAVSLSGSNVSIVDAIALILGNVTATGSLNATAATNLAVNGVVNANTLSLTATTGSMTQSAGSTITVATGPSNFVAGGTVTLRRTNSFTGSVNGWGDNSSPSPVPPEVNAVNAVGFILSGNSRNITSPTTTLTSSSAPPELVLSASAGTSSAKSSHQSNVSNANSAGVTIDVRNAAVQGEPIMAAVSLPKGSATSGTGFSFELPSTIRELVQSSDNVQATLPNGGPLGAWLKFDAQALRFEASAVPNGAFPIQVVIQLAKQRVMVVISERTE